MKTFTRFAVALFVLTCAPTVHALLGSFEPADGYTLQQIPGSSPSDFTDVVYYNAGQFGVNAGGGGPAQVAFNSPANLWTLKPSSQAGGFFTTSAIRNSFVSSAPPYPPFPFASTVPTYIVGNHFGGRTGFSALALRNEGNPVGPMEYDYKLDSYDFGGINPATVTTGPVGVSFYFCPNPVDPSPSDKFIMSFNDSLGVTGLQIGYTRNNQVQFRPGSSGAWTFPGITADSLNYDGFDVQIDLTNDTFALSYYDFSANAMLFLAPAGTPLGNPMLDLTHLTWWLDDQVTGGVGGKNFFDDFTFKVGDGDPGTRVPEPSAATLVVLAAGSLMTTSFARRRAQRGGR